ncbi:hypothetical protein BDA99DRAFT_540844 [Phascolomyces articulosus]|uniref:Uncharacterized protein n=1 Tax=Phascolomyces articulosus TaxID=60185 RepID=A0AAD5JTC9_9FUNG|nr:hypothetical protein BDA99DRAFT_540844 [Phascolomyces articulosus]
MHPAIVAAIVVGGVIVVLGGIEVGRRLHEEHREQREYAEFVHRHNNDFRKRNSFSDDDTTFTDDDDDDDDDDDNNNDTRKLNQWYRDYDNLRHRRISRRPGSSSMGSIKSNSRRSFEERESNLYHSAYELTEMEKSILDRRQRLQMEQARLDEEERDLQRRRELLASRGNNVNGLDTTTASTTTVQQNNVNDNPFFRPPLVQEQDQIPRPNFDENVPPSFFFNSQQPSPSPSPPLPPRPAAQQQQQQPEMTERRIIYDYDHHTSSSSSNESVVSSSSSSSHPSMYQSTGGLEASTAALGPRIDAIQAPADLTHTDTDWSDVVSSVSGHRSHGADEGNDGLSDEFSQLSVHSSNRGGRPNSVSGESTVSYDMLSFTDLDESRSQRL